jgi:hypothetical protein
VSDHTDRRSLSAYWYFLVVRSLLGR